MISAEIYKVVHLVGVLMIFLSLGGVALNAINGGIRNHMWKKPVAITHGLGMLFSLVGGFGLLARLGFAQGGLPGWVIAKLAIWLAFGALIGVFARKPRWSKTLWPTMIVMGAAAAYLAGSKPF